SIYPSPEGKLPAVPYSIPAAEQWSAKRAYSAATKGLFTCNQPARERGGNQPLLRIVLAAELELVDAAGALLDLFGRDQDLAHVFVGLAEMVLQLDHAVTQPPEVVHHAADLGADLIGRLAHAGVLQDLLHHLDRQHQERRRDDDDARAVGLLHHIVEAVMQLGIDRLRRHEHQGELLRLAGDQVFVGDVGDVLHHVLAHTLRRDLALVVGPGGAQRGD